MDNKLAPLIANTVFEAEKGNYRICDTDTLDGSNVSPGGHKAINKTQLWKLRSLYFLIKFTSCA